MRRWFGRIGKPLHADCLAKAVKLCYPESIHQYGSRVAYHGDACLAYPRFASLEKTTVALYDSASISHRSIACEDESLWPARGMSFVTV
jgi:hypothetical protein